MEGGEGTTTTTTTTTITMEELRESLWNAGKMAPTPMTHSLTKLMLRSCKLEGTLCHEIDCLPNLCELDVGDNQLSRLPFTIGGCQALTVVRVDNNALEGVPNTLSLLPRLETLDLSFNPDLAVLPHAVSALVVNTRCNVLLEGTSWIPSQSAADCENDDVDLVMGDLDDMGLGSWTVSRVERITLGESAATVFRVSTEEEGDVIVKRVCEEGGPEERMEKARAELDAEAEVLASGLFEGADETVYVPCLLGHVPSRVLCTSVVGGEGSAPASDFASRGVEAQRTVVTTLATFLARLHSLPSPRGVLSHGDACLPNFIVSAGGDVVEGMCDLGQAGCLSSSESDLKDVCWSIGFNLGARWLSLFRLKYSEESAVRLRNESECSAIAQRSVHLHDNNSE